MRGAGIAEVIATGPKSEIGKIGQSLSSLETEPPRLQAQMNRLVRMFGVVGLGVSVLAVALYGVVARPLARRAAGGHRARDVDAARRVSGRAGRLHGDGRLAHFARARSDAARRRHRNPRLRDGSLHGQDRHADREQDDDHGAAARRRSTRFVWTGPRTRRFPTHSRTSIQVGVLASARQPFDPMEKAFHELRRKSAPEAARPDDGSLEFVHVYGLRPDLLAVTQVWRPAAGGSKLVVASKGAPEAIAELCRLDGARLDALKQSVSEMAADGLRVLGVARAVREAGELPASPREFAFEFVGLVGLADPLRASAAAAVKECRSAGIRVVMITGDYPETAAAIARQAGLDAESRHDRPGARNHGRSRAEPGHRQRRTCSPASCPTRSCGSSTR